jgi:hypothetical protein
VKIPTASETLTLLVSLTSIRDEKASDLGIVAVLRI